MIKAAFFDIDGTIISIRTHLIPQATVDAIREIRTKGVKTFLCTSRARQFLTNIPGIEYDGLVCLTGAHCIDSDGNDISVSRMDPGDIAAAVLDAQQGRHPFIGLAADRIYAQQPEDPAIKFALASGGLKEDDIEGGVSAFPDLTSAADPARVAQELGILQVTGFFPSGPEEVRMMNLMPNSHTQRWCESFVDIISDEVDKAHGLQSICQHYGFKRDEIIAFGDGANDISMLQYAGIGVAMGNASDNVKDVADFVTEDVDDGGLSKALRFLIK